MGRILLLLENKNDYHLFSELLTKPYQVLLPSHEQEILPQVPKLLAEPFDLGIMDRYTMRQSHQQIQAKRNANTAIFLPFILITPPQNQQPEIEQLEQLVDDIMITPIEKAQFRTQIRTLLRAREMSKKISSLSLQLEVAKKQAASLQKQKKEAQELKTHFVSLLSHEFRNPLSSISGLVQMLEMYDGLLAQEKKQEIFQHVHSGIHRMNGLLDDLLLTCQADAGKLEFQPALLELEKFCRGLISELQSSLNPKRQTNFIYQGSNNPLVDGKLLRYILTNLLGNACKYSPADKAINFTVTCHSSEVIFKIQDQGIGIAQQDQDKLFDSFYRASNVGKIKGTGLGLAIVKQCVELHRGIVTVESELGVGTTFTVKLPSSL